MITLWGGFGVNFRTQDGTKIGKKSIQQMINFLIDFSLVCQWFWCAAGHLGVALGLPQGHLGVTWESLGCRVGVTWARLG